MHSDTPPFHAHEQNSKTFVSKWLKTSHTNGAPPQKLINAYDP